MSGTERHSDTSLLTECCDWRRPRPGHEIVRRARDHGRVMLRLSGGVIPGPDRRVWIPGPAGRPADATAADLPPGTPVAVGPRGAEVETVEWALTELAHVVEAGGPVAAGADVDLGDGFRSARTDGGAGDRRDAVLAALTVPGLGDRLGEPAALLVALFGPEATKPLGAAALAAIDQGRWAALR